MNDSTIRLSADTTALSDSLSKVADEMTAVKDAVTSSAAAMGANLDASVKPGFRSLISLKLWINHWSDRLCWHQNY